MDKKLIRTGPVLAVSLAALFTTSAAAVAAGPNYCDPFGGCGTHPSHYLKLSSSKVKPGKAVTLSGSVGHGCKTPGQVTIYSRAFKGATGRSFAGVPAVVTTINRKGAFKKQLTIKRGIKAGNYHVGGRCGGGNFGSATLKVT